jgi:hypothetical protein
MQNELSEQLRATDQAAANNLKGSARRKFMAGLVESLGRGGLSYWARELGWEPKTMRKGRPERESGLAFADRPTHPGLTRSEARLPTLRDDLRQLLDEQSQTNATFQSQRLYTRLRVQAVRTQLLEGHGYTEEQLPDNEVLRQRINALGYKRRIVKQNQPPKRSPRQRPSSTS